MKVNQRDIVLLNFELPNGSYKTHPALVISNQNVLEAEDIFYAVMISTKEYHDEFTFEPRICSRDSIPSSKCFKHKYLLNFLLLP